MKESKSLYSSDISSVVERDTLLTGLNETNSPGNILVSTGSDDLSWYYIFLHHGRLEKVRALLETRFRTFVHKTVSYSKKNRHVQTIEKPTIPGLLFVQGNKQEIQLFITDNLSGLYLATDRSSGNTAVISNNEMQSFIRLSAVEEGGIRVLEKPLEYYSEGNRKVRVVSGILKGTEGYIVRMSREKCLVTALGNITVAISGIIKESIEDF